MDDRLLSIVERIEALEEERRGLAGDIKDIYAEAKSAGYNPKALRAIVAERREDAAERAQRLALLDTYRAALGMLAGTPLGDAALERADAEPFEVRAARKIKRVFAGRPDVEVRLAPHLEAAASAQEDAA